ANLTSAEMAAAVGPFEGFHKNREPMLRVMQMHREAVEQINPAVPEYLKDAARDLWDEVVTLGKRVGYRNAQATVLAPTGTISYTVNMASDVTPQDIAESYFWGWQLGLKALDIYRDGSKQSQPLSTKAEGSKDKEEKVTPRPKRERLDDTRDSVTHKFNVG